MTARNLVESRALAVTEADRSGVLEVGLITPGWGSSGYYSAEVLEAAATAGVFPAGTQMFLDHPSETEMTDRPERSVKDLAAVLTEDAVWDGGQLKATVQTFPTYRPLLTDKTFAESIGVSIRALAESSIGEAEGRRGHIVESLIESLSVDFVTKAGRGGRILAVLESARAEAAEAEARIQHLMVDESTAQEGGDMPQDPSTTPQTDAPPADPPAPTTPPAEQPSAPETPDAPAPDVVATEPATPPTPANQEESMPQNSGAGGSAAPTNPREVMEARYRTLESRFEQLAARERARDIIDGELVEAWVAPSTIARLRSELLESLPVVNGTLDEAALRTTCVEARDRAETEAAEILNAAGAGTPRGLGALTQSTGGDNADRYNDTLTESFRSLGLSDAAAKTAVKGR